MILYNLDYYPYYIPEQYLQTTEESNVEEVKEVKDVNKIKNDRICVKMYYQFTKNCIIGGTIGFYFGIIMNDIIYYSLLGGSLGGLSTYWFK
jgi:hypothetical protein